MSYWQKPIKKIWEDWDFFFKMQNEDWTFQDLNWYKYSIVVENVNWVEILRESWEINISATELIKTIPINITNSQKEWTFYIEFKIIDTNWKVSITDKAEFYAKNTLHFN